MNRKSLRNFGAFLAMVFGLLAVMVYRATTFERTGFVLAAVAGIGFIMVIIASADE